MSKTIIKIEHLYKEYCLGVIGHGTLYRDMQSWWANVRGKEDPNSLIGRVNSDSPKNILALNNINMNVKQGEVLGIIGANGAGKSTLLKILSKVTAPTKGIIKVKGKIASLLEVGTGFHPELTGKENIYLNGAINGMNKMEVTRKLDEIANFAGVEKFIDTPVKRYSSGMHARLGFAVAAHLDPDILVVDEVLAVGDAKFQKKAAIKMQNVSESHGRTVIIVSHNMDLIERLCSRSVLLNAGSILAEGETEAIIKKYIGQETANLKPEKIWNESNRTYRSKGVAPGNELVKPISLRVFDEHGKLCSTFSEIEDINFEFECEVLRKANNMAIGLTITNHKNTGVLAMRDNSRDDEGEIAEPGRYLFKTKIQGNFLNDGFYRISIGCTEGMSIHVDESDIVSFLVKDTYNPDGARGLYPREWPDVVVRPKINWQKEKL
ncbi:MAG: ABC transporter ATP-binding protein [Proteobacteria bacterium]|nr:ABC transporter ATP-binding protein [Pseudomonadota bacterium]MBU1389476.1 ABC transporter ATP-binding protein [Pseudomonadota bacterium]MBU1541296.1 ABC transporter ATP-binding protein [Pseudomonadota bacterium]